MHFRSIVFAIVAFSTLSLAGTVTTAPTTPDVPAPTKFEAKPGYFRDKNSPLPTLIARVSITPPADKLPPGCVLAGYLIDFELEGVIVRRGYVFNTSPGFHPLMGFGTVDEGKEFTLYAHTLVREGLKEFVSDGKIATKFIPRTKPLQPKK